MGRQQYSDHKVCYNGQQMDAYYLKYLYKRFKSSFGKLNHKNIFAYTSLMVAHDAGGLRIQTIDEDLARFVKGMSQLDNTLTVILADHGNTYTDFPYIDMEGRYEMFHPALFMIIPSGVQKYLGDETMMSLRLNQERMITMIDLHKGFKAIANEKYNDGFLKTIAANRYCQDVPLRYPNLCVCEGWNSPGKNTTEFVGHLEFAIGKLNNIIMKASPDGTCKRLVPIMFNKVLQKNEGDFFIIKFDIRTSAGYGSSNNYDEFRVDIKSKLTGITENYEMELTSWDRISRYGGYRSCSKLKSFRLCVCDKNKTAGGYVDKSLQVLHERTSDLYQIFDGIAIVKEKRVNVIDDQLIVIERTYNERKYDDNDKEIDPYLISVTFEVINLYRNDERHYSVNIIFDYINNMKPLVAGNCNGVVQPNSVIYLCTLFRKWDIWQAEYSYKINYSEI